MGSPHPPAGRSGTGVRELPRNPLDCARQSDIFIVPSKFNPLLLFKSTLARNTGWMLLGQGLKLVIQAVYFTVIARSLGASKYGAFVGVLGLVGILLPFATLGSGYLLIKNVVRDRSQFSENWGKALTTTLLSSSFLFVVVVLLSRFALPATIPLALVMFVAASELLGLSITVICGQAFVAFDRLQWT